jgi:hypothetical protein
MIETVAKHHQKGRPVQPHPIKLCLNCSKPFSIPKWQYDKVKFCSRKCWVKYLKAHSHYNVMVECGNCGITFPKNTKYFNRASKDPRYNNKHYCSRKCYGQTLGNLHGFRVHPENRVRDYVSKYEYFIPQIIKLALQGLSKGAIAKNLNFPNPYSMAYSKTFWRMLNSHNIKINYKRNKIT